MITHEVGVLGQVDCLQSQAPEPLPPIHGFILSWRCTTTTRLTSPLSVHQISHTTFSTLQNKKQKAYTNPQELAPT